MTKIKVIAKYTIECCVAEFYESYLVDKEKNGLYVLMGTEFTGIDDACTREEIETDKWWVAQKYGQSIFQNIDEDVDVEDVNIKTVRCIKTKKRKPK